MSESPSTPTDFVSSLAGEGLSVPEIAVAVIWCNSREEYARKISLSEIVSAIEDSGFAKQNRTRLFEKLKKDKRTTSHGRSFGISLRHRTVLDDKFDRFTQHKPVRRSNSFLPLAMFSNTRGYIEKVVLQINASFDASLFDCTAVMCRRLLETLIIEAYESLGRAGELKRSDGHFMMFSGLLQHLENDKLINLGRESLNGLKNFKKLGDQSAHNRRYNARQSDLTAARDGIRIAAEELLHLSKLAP